jgi:hypothetical protein
MYWPLSSDGSARRPPSRKLRQVSVAIRYSHVRTASGDSSYSSLNLQAREIVPCTRS